MKSFQHVARAGTALFAALTFVLSLYYTFPAQVVTMRAAQEVAKATGGQVRIKVGQAALWRLSGVATRDVSLQIGDHAPVLIDAAKVRLRLLPLLLLRGSVYGQIQLGQGLAEAVWQLGGDHEGELKLDNIDLSRPAWLARLLGVPMQGVLSGSATLIGAPRWPLLRGNVDVSLERGSIGPLTVEGVALPQVGLGQLQLTLDIVEGQARIAALRQTGGNINLEARGKVLLAEPLDMSSLDVCGKIRIEPAFLHANPKLSAAVQLAEVQLKRDSNGFLNVPLTGSMRAPSLRPGLCPNR